MTEDIYTTNTPKKQEIKHKMKYETGARNKGYYNAIWFDSTWELAFYIYHRDKGNDIKRSDLYLPYDIEGQIHHYNPDFEMGGVIYEVKGYEDYKIPYKQKAYPDIIYLYKEDIKPYIKYVKELYNVKDLRYIYEDKEERYKKCLNCNKEFIPIRKEQKFCCHHCSVIYQKEHTEEYKYRYEKTYEHRKKLSIANKNQHKNIPKNNKVKILIGKTKASLSDEQALEIYNLSISGEYTQKEIAEKYNINIFIVSNIKLKKTYRWLHNNIDISKPKIITKRTGQKRASLSDKQALEIYNLSINGEYTQKEIAERFNTSNEIVSSIKLKKSYKWIHEN